MRLGIIPAILILSTRRDSLEVPEVFYANVLDAARLEDDSKDHVFLQDEVPPDLSRMSRWVGFEQTPLIADLQSRWSLWKWSSKPVVLFLRNPTVPQ